MKIPTGIKRKKDYISFLKSLEVEEIYLAQCSASFDRTRFTEAPREISLHGRSKFGEPAISNSTFTVTAAIEVFIGAADPKEAIGKLRAAYNLKFKVKGKELDEEHVRQFAKTNIKIIVWPFFREFVHNITSRFGIPPVTVPIHAE